MSQSNMNDNIQIDLEILGQKIADIRNSGAQSAFTSDIIRAYMGGYFLNKGVAANISWNAQFGKLLSKHREQLGLEQVRSDASVNDDLGRPTTCSEWRL